MIFGKSPPRPQHLQRSVFGISKILMSIFAKYIIIGFRCEETLAKRKCQPNHGARDKEEEGRGKGGKKEVGDYK